MHSQAVSGLELRSHTDATGVRPQEYAQRARNVVLSHLLDDRLPVQLLRQIRVNFTLDAGLPARHKTLGALHASHAHVRHARSKCNAVRVTHGRCVFFHASRGCTVGAPGPSARTSGGGAIRPCAGPGESTDQQARCCKRRNSLICWAPSTRANAGPALAP